MSATGPPPNEQLPAGGDDGPMPGQSSDAAADEARGNLRRDASPPAGLNVPSSDSLPAGLRAQAFQPLVDAGVVPASSVGSDSLSGPGDSDGGEHRSRRPVRSPQVSPPLADAAGTVHESSSASGSVHGQGGFGSGDNRSRHPVLLHKDSWRRFVTEEPPVSGGNGLGSSLPLDVSEISTQSRDTGSKGSMFAPVRIRKEIWVAHSGPDEPLKDYKIVVETTTGDKNQKMPRGYFTPYGSWRRKWDLYIIVLLVYVAILSVFVHSFLPKISHTSPWFWVERWVDVSFIIDIVLCFRTAYQTRGGKLETRKNKIALHYLRTWFPIDAIGTFPWDYLDYLVVGGSQAGWLQLPRLLRIFRILKAMKVLKVLRLKQNITRLEVKLRLKYGYLRLIWLIVIVMLITHWCGCLFYLFGTISGAAERSWIGQDGIPSDIYGRYLVALYFAAFTVTTIGYGDVTPQNAVERVYVVFMMLVGAFMFAFIISQVGDTVAELTVARAKYRREMDELTEFVTMHGVSDSLAFDLRRYFQHRTMYRHADDNQEMLDSMSPDLRAKVMAHVYEDSLNGSYLLKGLSEDYREDIYVNIKSCLARPGEMLFREGDDSEYLFTVMHGHVDITDENGSRRLGPGSVFGESELLFGRRRRGSAKAVDYCDYAKVPRDAILSVLRRDRGVLRDLRHQEAGRIWERALERAEKDVRFWIIVHKLRSVARAEDRKRRLSVARLHAQAMSLGTPQGATAGQSQSTMTTMAGAGGLGGLGGLDREGSGRGTQPSSGSEGIMHGRRDVATWQGSPSGNYNGNDNGNKESSASASDSDDEWSESSEEWEQEEREEDPLLLSRKLGVDAPRAAMADTHAASAMPRLELEHEYVARGKNMLRLMAKAQALVAATAALHEEVSRSMPEHFPRIAETDKIQR